MGKIVIRDVIDCAIDLRQWCSNVRLSSHHELESTQGNELTKWKEYSRSPSLPQQALTHRPAPNFPPLGMSPSILPYPGNLYFYSVPCHEYSRLLFEPNCFRGWEEFWVHCHICGHLGWMVKRWSKYYQICSVTMMWLEDVGRYVFSLHRSVA